MKIRNGFVSNSSSSSFIIIKDKLTQEQKEKIYNHILEAEKHSEFFDFGSINNSESWSISEDEYYLTGYCMMDNFNMHEFLINYLNISRDIVRWEF